MTIELERQVHEYAEFLDTTLPVLEASVITSDADLIETVPLPLPTRYGVRRRPWLVAAAVLIAVIVVIGGSSLLFSGGGGAPVVDDLVEEPEVTQTTAAPPTTLAASAAIIPGVEGSIYLSVRWLHTGFATQEEIGGPMERVEQVWYLDADTWRWETPLWQSGDSTEMQGQVTITANQQRFEFQAHSNTYTVYEGESSGEGFNPAVDPEVIFECDETGCAHSLDGDRWDDCTFTENVVVLGRETIEHSCTRPPEWNDQEITTITLNIDETGRTLRMVQTHTTETGEESILEYEILELNTSPTFTADLFVFECPTNDCRDSSLGADPFDHPMIGLPAPEVSGDLVGGGTFDLADHRGERVILLFWASWCPPCTEELVFYQDFSKASPDITVVTGAVIDQQQEVTAVVNDLAITLPVLDLFTQNLTEGNYVGDVWGGLGIPLIVFIDETGRVVAIQDRARGSEGLTEVLGGLGW